MSEHLLCLDATPTFLNAFDFSVAPHLLFYSYIPILVVLLFLSIFIARKDNFSLKSKLLLTLGISFSVWIINMLIQWVAVDASIVYFAWQVTALLEIFIPLSAVYLTYVFIDGKDVAFWLKCIFAIIVTLVAVLVPTSFNMSGFDVYNCEGIVGQLTYYVYAFEVFSIFWIISLGFRRYILFKKLTDENAKQKKEQVFLITIGSSLFLFVFAVSNIFGELSKVYEINLAGPLGMLAFLGFLVHMIVRYKTFNIKLLASEVLIWGVVFLVGAQFFFIRNQVNYFLNGFTFILTIILGNYLINSVKREVEQREELQKLLKEREGLEHLISHKVKGSFTRSKYIFAEMLDGGFGQISDQLKAMAKGGLDANNSGINTVDLILNSYNLQNGTIKFEMNDVNFKDLVAEVVSEKKHPAEERKLELGLDIKEGSYTVLGDAFWLKEAVNNLVENAIRYTKEGSVKVLLENNNGKVLLSVIDTGVGVTEEDKKNLFKQGGRGKDSVKINTDSTGYGLYSVKLILDAHKGRVWVDSEGEGKGSRFYVELTTK